MRHYAWVELQGVLNQSGAMKRRDSLPVADLAYSGIGSLTNIARTLGAGSLRRPLPLTKMLSHVCRDQSFSRR
jgi:hypothetical protein